MKQIRFYLAIVTGLFLLLMCGCKHISGLQNDTSSISSNNLEGSVWSDDVMEIDSLTEKDESVFYISKVGIMKYNKFKCVATVLVKSASINSFRIYDDLMYYCENDSTIYKINLNGENRTKVVETSQIAANLLVENSFANFEVYQNDIYIKSSGTSFVRFSISTQKFEDFADDVGEYAFSENYFFYIDHAEKTFSIFRQNLSTGQIDLLRGDGISKYNLPQEDFDKYKWYDNVKVVNDQLYYTMRDSAKLFKLVQSGNDTLIDGFDNVEDAEYLTVTNNENKLYYTLESGSLKDHLFEYDAQTGAKKEVIVLDNMNYSLGFKVINGYVFYYSTPDKNLIYSQI